MATDFTQDTVLHYLQSSGGSVKNSDLLLHFRAFVREHPERDRNRELFKKFVNSVATVQQVDGVSHVVLRKKFRGHVPGSGDRSSSAPPRGAPAGKRSEPTAERSRHSPAGRIEKPPQGARQGETTGVIARKTVLPAAGIILNNNNNNVETNVKLKQQQILSIPEAPVRPVEVQARRTEVRKTHNLQFPAQDQQTKVEQPRLASGPPPGITPVVPPVGHNGGPYYQEPVPEPVTAKQAFQQYGGFHHETPPQSVCPAPQVTKRRFRNRQSYKAAVSCDEDEEEEDEEIPIRRGLADGAWPQNAPLGSMGRAISASTPCIIDPPGSPLAVSSTVSSSSDRKVPQICIQDVKAEMPQMHSELGGLPRGQWAGGPGGLQPGSVPVESTRRSLPLEAERFHLPSAERALNTSPHHNVRSGSPYLHPSGAQLEPSGSPDYSHQVRPSSSHSSVFTPSPDADVSSRGSPWNSSSEDLQARPGRVVGDLRVHEVLQRSQRPRVVSATHYSDSKTTAPWHHSSDNLYEHQEPAARVTPWHHSTGNLQDDPEEAGSSDGSTLSPAQRRHPTVARRFNSQLRSRMCISMGGDLDQLLQEEARAGGGTEAARLNRLHLLSSSLSLGRHLSSSSLSSCQSLGDLVEATEGKGGRRSLPATSSSSMANHEESSKQSSVPLDPREHAWLVKGAAGAWSDIYSLFREDSSLLNKRDFISGFTVLHWIAKHGDHRVLNTLWYGVHKAGLTLDINARSTSGHTPLHVAAIYGHKNMIRLLVSTFHADVTLRDNAGKKAWQYLSGNASLEVLQLLRAPPRAAGIKEGRVMKVAREQPQQQHRRRRRHHLSSASSGERPLIISGTKVKRSSSLAAFLKHKSLHRFQGHQSDSSI